MKRPGNQLLTVLAVACLGGICAGCTIPQYSRTVVHKYDGDGKLIGTEVTENISQVDPHAKPLVPVLENQTYAK